MWLFNKTGIRRQELRLASGLRRAFSDARNGKTVSKYEQQFIEPRYAYTLLAMNPHARIRWAQVVCKELADFFDLTPDRPYPDHPIFFVTLVDLDCMTADDATDIDIETFKRILRRGLRGLSYLGMVDVALYVNASQQAEYSGTRGASWHLHALVWGCARSEIKERIKRLNESGRYRAIVNGLPGADWDQIKETDLGTVLGYMLESPCNEYRIGKYKNEETTEDGEVICRFKSNKARARPRSLIKLFHLLKDLYVDQLTVAGGEGAHVLRTVKRQEFRMPNGRH